SIAGAINKFIGKQYYSQTNDFEALKPYLDAVIGGSSRLTVIIFCDGETPITGTPYDQSINPIFQQRLPELKRAKQPFVVVLRTQLGKYVSCSVNFPPGMISLPDFPPLTPPPAPAPPVAAPLPSRSATPLVIVGTHIETNWEAYRSALTNPRPAAPPAAPRAEGASAPPAVSSTTPAGMAATNAPATPGKSGGTAKALLALFAGILVGGIALAVWLISRSGGGDGGSLISRSMEK
ncbi:MAG TPA: hypothetical protein VN625_08180, partial [Desulfuromonadaceae bacterium]|nr:hypothetical protein [Desulfuromonadaceae bacterium]